LASVGLSETGSGFIEGEWSHIGKLRGDGPRWFRFRLAALLGCTVAELDERISASELSEWREFYDKEPWGWEPDCFKSGIIAATVANVHRDSKKKRTPFEATDFIPGHVKQPSKSNPKLLKSQLQLAFAGAKHAAKIRSERGEKAIGSTKGAGTKSSEESGKPSADGGREADCGRSKKAGACKDG
jgi:hypothetical protein